MRKKTKSALVVFLFMAIAFVVVFSFDYTDSYVSDRFNRAVTNGQYVKGDPFSLDAFLEYYDWDKVCVTTPGSIHDYRNRVGRQYKHTVKDDSLWSLVFIKDNYVIAEIPIQRSFLEYPADLVEPCFDRWSAIISLDDNDTASEAELRMTFVGN